MDEGTIKSYVIGFALSIVLTLVAFWAVLDPGVFHVTNNTPAILAIIIALAFVQLAVQMLFFLHLGAAKKARWRTGIFFATFGLVLIVTLGSLWIMNHLNYNMMASPAEMQQYIQSQQGF